MDTRPVEHIRLGPQPGPQTEFLSTDADIAFYGGAAGGGKSFAMLLEPVRHYANPLFGGVIFRKNTTMIRNEGGLWDESYKMYSKLNARPVETVLEWTFPSGARMKFAHLERDKSVYDWQGSQIPYIGFDELTHFSEHQFCYMMSRNRSTSGVAGYMRGTCNPDVSSWVRRWIDWYIGPDGYPIPERSGKLRWFLRDEDKMIWADTREELIEKYPPTPERPTLPKSFTFIPSSVYDNKILMQSDPAYLANLLALPRVERLRLLGGNWNVRPAAGDYFQREWFEILDALPKNPLAGVRYWDRAATRPSETNPDPDWTAGCKLFKYDTGVFVIANVTRLRESPMRIESTMKNTASQDTPSIPVCVEQEPGSAGVADAQRAASILAGYEVRIRRPTNDKVTRALPASAQAEAGNIYLLRGEWNEDFLLELENFPDGGHDDQVDAFTGAFNELTEEPSILDAFRGKQ